jgi:cephalosporin hydroxylase
MKTNIEITENSLEILRNIDSLMVGHTFHHHYHILYDIRNTIDKKCTYVEIGAFSGGSAALMASHKLKTDVISIDLGYPISPNVVYENVQKFKNEDNSFTYIQGNSTYKETINRLEEVLNGGYVDILFIDGDHSYNGVISDFNLYDTYVSKGGYIVFDDYLDSEHSPEVKIAVNDLVEKIKDTYEIIGTFENVYKARPDWLKDNNCFIIQKK